MSSDDKRAYRIKGILGKGGFGVVYRATLERTDGFTTEVAIKLLHLEEVPERVLQRFRDEARILGLIRDRAVVRTDPPTMLEGQVALVMEFVDGLSCRHLLLKHGPWPPRVVLEAVQEVARALDSVYRQPGPDGAPLRLTHRDIKPANLQITPTGGVRLLDFGIAKADFAERESETTASIMGTPSYMSPERLEGESGPEADIYALGVVIRRLATGAKPKLGGRFIDPPNPVELTEAHKQALQLADEMMHDEAEDRPTAREVETRCIALIKDMEGPTLREWAEKRVPLQTPMKTDDALVGEVITESTVLPSEAHTRDVNEDPSPEAQTVIRPASSALPVLGVMGLGFGVLLGALALAAVAATLLTSRQTPPDDAEPAAIEAPPEVVAKTKTKQKTKTKKKAKTKQKPAPEPAAPVAPEPAADPAPAQTAAPAPVPVAAVEPAAPPEPTAVPEPVAVPDPAPEPVATKKITFGSMPPGAAVLVDGKKVGTTPLVGVALTVGAHSVVIQSSSGRIERSIKVGARQPSRYIWGGGDKWNVYY